ncbi:MAG: hypothetical protein DI533_21755 [Cereibacter sphaeroides]|uniref:Uncharacterized protein n=1 Tax=Cereibacter sphaeroides TaxID=1063 RepID=A0A2W5U9S5_CERSP|nr:MAG: hypothetical protein DI533_21755 [Cereibacter sphaeroides]
MQPASSAIQRLKNAVLETRSAVDQPVTKATRDQLREAARLAQHALGLKGTPRHVLIELAVSHRAVGEGLPVVWPSNERLASKVGVTTRAITAAIKELVDEGLIIRRDSANQKRFRRVGADGKEAVYGLDLTPLLRRQAEFERTVTEIEAAKLEQKRLRAVIGADRRRVRNALEWLAMHTEANTDELAARFGSLSSRTPARPTKDGIKPALANDWARLAEDAERLLAITDVAEFKLLETPGSAAFSTSDSSTNDGEKFRHKEPESDLSIENCLEVEVPREAPPRSGDDIDLKMVLEACPSVTDYPEPIRSAYDVVAAGSYLRPSTTLSAETWASSVLKIGAPMTAVAVIYAYQRLNDDASSGAARIRSPGGFTQSILNGVAAGTTDLRAELATLRRKHIQ